MLTRLCRGSPKPAHQVDNRRADACRIDPKRISMLCELVRVLRHGSIVGAELEAVNAFRRPVRKEGNGRRIAGLADVDPGYP